MQRCEFLRFYFSFIEYIDFPIRNIKLQFRDQNYNSRIPLQMQGVSLQENQNNNN